MVDIDRADRGSGACWREGEARREVRRRDRTAEMDGRAMLTYRALGADLVDRIRLCGYLWR